MGVYPPQGTSLASSGPGQQIINGSFESNGGYTSQTFTGWIVTGDWDAVNQANGYSAYAGLWSAYGGNFPYVANGLSQTLKAPVPVATITAFGFYGLIAIASDNVQVTIYYSDGTSTTTANLPITSSWLYTDLTTALTAGKMVTGLKIVDRGTNGTMDAQIDAVTLMGTPIQIGMTNTLFYPPQS